MIVYHYPKASNNPYQKLMFSGLAQNNIEPRYIQGGMLGFLKIAFFGKGHVLHLHWITGPIERFNFFGAAIRLVIFNFILLVWKVRGKKIFWTIHNLVNHEKKSIWLDKLSSKFVSNLSSAILVHGNAAIPIVARKYGVSTKKIKIVHHGNYEDVIQAKPKENYTSEDTRFLFFGSVRAYKGLIELIEAFKSIEGNVTLHIAGTGKDSRLLSEIKKRSERDNRIHLSLSYVSDKQLEELLSWCDVVVLPYKDIFTSGSLLMAMTAGRPVIAPNAGLIPEYISFKNSFLYDLSDSEGIHKSLMMAIKSDNLEEMGNLCLDQSKNYRWNKIGSVLADIYQN